MRSKLRLVLALSVLFLFLDLVSAATDLPVGMDSPYVVSLNLSGQDIAVVPHVTTAGDGYLTYSTSLLDRDSGVGGCFIGVYDFSDPFAQSGLIRALEGGMGSSCVGVQIKSYNNSYIGMGLFEPGAWRCWGMTTPLQVRRGGEVDAFGVIIALFENETLNEILVKSARFGRHEDDGGAFVTYGPPEMRFEDLSGMPVVLTDRSIEAEVGRYPLLIVDCWAESCGPCGTIEPVIEELARQYKGLVVFGKLNAGENMHTASRYGITVVPTLVVFKNGTMIDKMEGAHTKSALENKIQEYL